MTNEQILELLEQHIDAHLVSSHRYKVYPHVALMRFRNDLKARMAASEPVSQPEPQCECPWCRKLRQVAEDRDSQPAAPRITINGHILTDGQAEAIQWAIVKASGLPSASLCWKTLDELLEIYKLLSSAGAEEAIWTG